MFEPLIHFFNLILYQPLFNFLVLLYQYLPGGDLGLTIIIFTLIIKIILYPLGAQGMRAQKALQDLQPKIDEVQKKFKDDKTKQTMAVMELYKKEKVNPFSGCLPLLIQLPILIAVYRIFWQGFGTEQFNYLYSFISRPSEINSVFLGIIDLSKSGFLTIEKVSRPLWPNIILIILTGISQFFQTKMASPQFTPKKKELPDFSQIMQKQMIYFFPFFTIIFLLNLPSALALYWLTSTLFTIGQQFAIFKKI